VGEGWARGGLITSFNIYISRVTIFTSKITEGEIPVILFFVMEGDGGQEKTQQQSLLSSLALREPWGAKKTQDHIIVSLVEVEAEMLEEHLLRCGKSIRSLRCYSSRA
jgi:hypothetical protein